MIAGLTMLVAAAGAGYVAVTQYLAKQESGSSPTQQPVDPLGEEPWQQLDRRKRVYTKMLELDQKAAKIWKNIDALQADIDAYHKQFRELENTYKQCVIEKLCESHPHTFQRAQAIMHVAQQLEEDLTPKETSLGTVAELQKMQEKK